MSILLTGFERFGCFDTNPSERVAGQFAAEHHTAVLPVDFAAATRQVRRLMREHAPAVVLSLGLANNRTQIELERVAINLMDAPIPDNAGAQPCGQRVSPVGPDAYFTTLPVKAMLTSVRLTGVAASLSLSAGSYVCNAVMYAALDEAARLPAARRPRCGFIHLPPVEAVPFPDQVAAIKAALGAVFEDEASDADGAVD